MPASDLAQIPLDHEVALLVDAAERAGEIAMSFFRRDPDVWTKHGDSPVTEADIAVDAFLRQTLLDARPDYGWLSEEAAEMVQAGVAGRTFVVDPIDGTRGFIEGSTNWCVSVAIVENGRPIAGVLDCPARAERYSAVGRHGAWKNGVALKVGPPASPARLAGPRNLIDRLDRQAGSMKRMPYIPSLAYRIAMIAGGQLDASLVKPNSHDWDLAAADLILEEAGGRLLTLEGHSPLYLRDDPRHGTLIAGSGELLAELAAAVATGDH